MLLEKTLKREDGSRVEINVSASMDYNRDSEIKYRVDVYHCLPWKRKFVSVWNGDDYEYRRLLYKDRQKWVDDKIRKYISEEEIYEAKLSLWEKLKPVKP